MDKNEKKEYDRNYYIKNKEKILNDTHIYQEKNREIVNKKSREHYKKNRLNHNNICKDYYRKNKVKISEQKKEYRKKNKDKIKKWFNNHYATNEAYKTKHIARALAAFHISLDDKSCEKCGSTEKLHRHHPDYSKPLEIKILCEKHHNEEHKVNNV